MKNPNRKRDWFNKDAWVVIAVIAGVALLAILASLYLTSRHTLTDCTVTDKDRTVKVSGSDGSTTSTTSHRVYTTCGVFRVEDELFFLYFNSADTYGSLIEDETYNLEVVGWRNGFFSLFPNIVAAEKL